MRPRRPHLHGPPTTQRARASSARRRAGTSARAPGVPRPVLAPALVLALCLLLGACGLPRPFQHQAYAPAGNPLAAPRGGVSVALPPLVGAPRPVARRLADALAGRLREREIAAAAVSGPGTQTPGLMLLGWAVRSGAAGSRTEARAEADTNPDTDTDTNAGMVKVALRWTLVAPSGRIVAETAQTVTLALADWKTGSPAAVETLANAAAPVVAALVLPADAATAQRVATPAAAPPPPRDPTQPGPAPPDTPARAQADANAASVPPGRHPAAVDDITRLVLAPPQITRAPGDGRTALAQALTRLLRQNGVGIVDQPRPDRLTVRGAVEVLPGDTSDQQRVSIVWEVLDASGASLGKVNQANVIPRGLLDEPWGDTALLIAEGAAAGVGEILVRKGLVPAP